MLSPQNFYQIIVLICGPRSSMSLIGEFFFFLSSSKNLHGLWLYINRWSSASELPAYKEREKAKLRGESRKCQTMFRIMKKKNSSRVPISHSPLMGVPRQQNSAMILPHLPRPHQKRREVSQAIQVNLHYTLLEERYVYCEWTL